MSELEDALSVPSQALIADLADGSGNLAIVGAGGKMGPTLCLLARRALNAAGRGGDRVYAISRWSDRESARRLEQAGVDIVTQDLLGEDDLDAMPDARDVVFMVGAKFGASDQPSKAWAINVALSDRVGRRYRDSRVVALSTGNVYPFVAPGSGGSVETDTPNPVGEYAMSCLGRERVLQDRAAMAGTPVALIRLNYAVDLRYGVLADIGAAIQRSESVDIGAGSVNVVWQGYANEVILRSLRHASPDAFVLNLTGPETASVSHIAEMFADRLDKPLETTGNAPETALLSNATRCHALFGYPPVSLGTLVNWQAEWLRNSLPLLGKPTKFTVRDGQF